MQNFRPIQVTITLDSGTFVIDQNQQNPDFYDIGYFKPHIIVHADGEEIADVNPAAFGYDRGSLVTARHIDRNGTNAGRSLGVSRCLRKHLLRLPDLYNEKIAIDEKKFHCLLRFDFGLFSCSKPKIRDFKEVELDSGKWKEKGPRKPMGPIAHDLVILDEIAAAGEEITFAVNGQEIWSSKDHPDVEKRLDIEILADNTTAEMFYCHCFKDPRHSYWLPNQGDPPPDSVGGRP